MMLLSWCRILVWCGGADEPPICVVLILLVSGIGNINNISACAQPVKGRDGKFWGVFAANFLYLIGLCIPNVKAESLLGIIGLNLALDLVNSCYGGWPIWCRLGQESMSIGDPIKATMVRGGFKNHWKYSCPKLGKLRIIMIIKKLKSACSTIPLQQLYDLSTQWQKVGILVYLCSYRWV